MKQDPTRNNKYSPGRWYASDVAKHVLVSILKNYDFEIPNVES